MYFALFFLSKDDEPRTRVEFFDILHPLRFELTTFALVIRCANHLTTPLLWNMCSTRSKYKWGDLGLKWPKMVVEFLNFGPNRPDSVIMFNWPKKLQKSDVTTVLSFLPKILSTLNQKLLGQINLFMSNFESDLVTFEFSFN